MEKEELDVLYDAAILEENRHPYHYEKCPDADLTIEAYNPLCGDQFKIFLFTDNEKIHSAFFHGYGCAVSKASTSVLVRELEGCTLREARQKCITFQQWLQQEGDRPDPIPGPWQPFAAVQHFPGRLSCAVLAWESLTKDLS